MTAPALEIRNLRKNFGAIQVANDINLALPRGARHALIGPNGAGKTTLVNLITGRVRASIRRRAARRRRHYRAVAGGTHPPRHRPHLPSEPALP